MPRFITSLLLALALLTPEAASAQTATSTSTATATVKTATATATFTPTPPSEEVCSPICAMVTANPTEVAEIDAQLSATPTPTQIPSTLAAQAAAGTSAPSPVFLASANSDAHSGVIRLGTGTNAIAGTQVVAIFPFDAYSAPPIVLLQARTSGAALCGLFATWSASSVTISCANAPLSSQPVGYIEFEYVVQVR